MINWEAVAKWRDELRSGKYQQGKNYLRDANDNYCCLGVFTEAVAKIKPISTRLKYHYSCSFSVLPTEAKSILGTKSALPSVFGALFSVLNDAQNFSFDEIADLLDLAILEHQAGVPDNELIY